MNAENPHPPYPIMRMSVYHQSHLKTRERFSLGITHQGPCPNSGKVRADCRGRFEIRTNSKIRERCSRFHNRTAYPLGKKNNQMSRKKGREPGRAFVYYRWGGSDGVNISYMLLLQHDKNARRSKFAANAQRETWVRNLYLSSENARLVRPICIMTKILINRKKRSTPSHFEQSRIIPDWIDQIVPYFINSQSHMQRVHKPTLIVIRFREKREWQQTYQRNMTFWYTNAWGLPELIP